MIPVNITDAAADVLFQSLGQWKKWRKELAAARNDQQFMEPEGYLGSQNIEMSYLHTSENSFAVPTVIATTGAQNMATQRAAQAALNFAKSEALRRANTKTRQSLSSYEIGRGYA